MPGPLPNSAVYRIVVRISVGEDPAAIAQVVCVSRESVYRIQLNIDLFNAPYSIPNHLVHASTHRHVFLANCRPNTINISL